MKDRICMIGHRGFSGKFHENTEQAFTEAAKNKSGGCETDIRMTKDGIFVCSHNAEVVLDDGTELKVSESTFEELTRLPLKNKRTDDKVYLCTFKRYLEIMRDNNLICFVELKGDFNDEQVKAIFDLVIREYDLSKCILQSFSVPNLIKARNLFPKLPLMLTYGSGESNYEICFEYGFSLDIDYNVFEEKMIEEFHSRNLEIALWTVNEEDDFKRCLEYDVDYIESDIFGGKDK